jgi:hypothetical protein
MAIVLATTASAIGVGGTVLHAQEPADVRVDLLPQSKSRHFPRLLPPAQLAIPSSTHGLLHAAALSPGAQAATRHLVVAGLAGGAVGWLAGAYVVGAPLARANPLDSDQVDDGAWTPGMVMGFELGQAVGIPLAVHLANDRQGDLSSAMIASFALGAVGTALLWTGDFDAVFEQPARQVVLIAVPIAQLATSIHFARQ